MVLELQQGISSLTLNCSHDVGLELLWPPSLSYFPVCGTPFPARHLISASVVPYYGKLCFMNCELYTPGKIHPLLQLDTQSVKDNTRLPSKLKFLCGSYVLQANRHKFDKSEVDPACVLCKRSEESIEHFLLTCSSLSTVRDPILKDIQSELENSQNIRFFNLSVKDQIQMILDCTILMNNTKVKHRKQELQTISKLEYFNRKLVHSLYSMRYQSLKKLNTCNEESST